MAQPASLRSAMAPVERASSVKHLRKYDKRRMSSTCASWLRPAPSRPAYYDYLSPEDIKRASAEHYWKIVNVDLDAEATFWSCLRWIPGFLKFHVIPYPLKFLFLVLWKPVRAVLFELHRRNVLLLCRLDAVLSRKPKDVFVATNGSEARFSISLALKRLHCNRSIVDDAAYWLKLLAQMREGK